MKISLVREGLLNPAQLTAWTRERQQQIRDGVARGMKRGGEEVAEKVRAQAVAALNIKKKSFTKTFRAKVRYRDRTRMPVLDVGSMLRWLGIHETGGTVQGPLLIPLGGARVGRKRFKTIVNNLIRSGNAYFREVRGKVILFAENIAENRAETGRFASRYRQALRGRGGGGKLKEVPIAVLMPRVQLKKRLRVNEIVRANLGVITGRIEEEIARNG